jgi:hypothetical protein
MTFLICLVLFSRPILILLPLGVTGFPEPDPDFPEDDPPLEIDHSFPEPDPPDFPDDDPYAVVPEDSQPLPITTAE